VGFARRLQVEQFRHADRRHFGRAIFLPFYRENEMLVCTMQNACPEDGIGFRYEAPIVIKNNGIELLSQASPGKH